MNGQKEIEQRESALEKQLGRVPFGGTLATFKKGPSVVSFLPRLALIAFGVFWGSGHALRTPALPGIPFRI